MTWAVREEDAVQAHSSPCGLVMYRSMHFFLYEVCFNIVVFAALMYADVALSRCWYEKHGVSILVLKFSLPSGLLFSYSPK
jgi:hypothetical protein